MQTIDEIKIFGDEDGFHVIVHTDDGDRHEYRVGLPDQIKTEVDRTIGAWLAEGELVRALHSVPDTDGYDKSDPKHPMWHDTMSGIYDNREGK